jgi:hypothetical protein
MPFYCGKRSAGTCVVLGPKKYSTHSLWKEGVLLRRELSRTARLGRAGVTGYAPGFFEPAASHLPASPSLVTKDYSDRLLGMAPYHVFAQSSGSIS